MKALIATTAAVFLAVSGCTTTPRTSTPTAPTAAATTASAPPASVSPPASPTALGWKDIPAATTDTSDFEVLLSDKKLLIAGGDDPWGPESFAVLGDQILVQDSTDGIITYSDRRRTGRARLDSGDYAEDLLVRGSELYVLQGNGAEAANRKVHVYSSRLRGRVHAGPHPPWHVPRRCWTRLDPSLGGQRGGLELRRARGAPRRPWTTG